MSSQITYARLAMSRLQEALEDSPVVLIHGSRQCGKTTLARILETQGYEYLSFDDDNQRRAAKADSIGFVSGLPDKVILDEVQRVPELFTTLKATVDNDRRAGRFVLTGSANVLLLPQLADSLAGRMEIIRLRPLAQVELAAVPPTFFEQAFTHTLDMHQTYTRLGEQLATVVAQGGYPAALARSTERRRMRWYDDYITTLVQRDVQDLARIHKLDAIPRLLTAVSGQTARLFNVSDLAAPFSLSRPTITEYLTLLEQLFLLEQLPPWHSNKLRRLIKKPKLHITDTGLACALLGLTSKALWKDKETLGQLLETYIYQELRKQAEEHERPLQFYHFRDKDKVEVDIMVQQGQQMLGIEIKAAATVSAKDFKGLIKLQSALGKNFVAGMVFYDGERILSFGERLYAVPISLLTPTLLTPA